MNKLSNTFNPLSLSDEEVEKVSKDVMHIVDEAPPFMSNENKAQLVKTMKDEKQLTVLFTMPDGKLPQ